jgi:hypothetical protein
VKITPEAAERNRQYAAARVRALNALSILHREDYERLRDEERRKMGLPPAGHSRARRSA